VDDVIRLKTPAARPRNLDALPGLLRIARGRAGNLAFYSCPPVAKTTTYEGLKTSCRRWHGDMTDIVDQQ
jgi:hypothetical protein